MNKKPLIALTIPTGIAADIGGYAGDAGAIVREFSKYFKVIVNPNAVNGGILSAINDDMYYVEGYILDEFFKGNVSLEPLNKDEKNKIGIIFDKDIPADILNIHLNTIEALKIVKGYDIAEIEYTKESTGVSFCVSDEGISTGCIKNEKTLLDAGKNLLKKGVSAIAVVCYFNDDADDINYENGNGVDPIGGIEAVLSHFLSKELKVPVAHSPAFNTVDISYKKANPKVASEFISSTYLPCIIEGLNRAPRIKSYGCALTYKDVNYFVCIKSAMGSASVLKCIENNINICAVNNPNALSVGCKELKISAIIGKVAEFNCYGDCLNFIRNKLYGMQK